MRKRFVTPSGLAVDSRKVPIDYDTALDGLAERLDRSKGALFSSGIDYPGRYSRWEFGFANPPIELVGVGRRLEVRALNHRGERLLILLRPILAATPQTRIVAETPRAISLEVEAPGGDFAEEERSLQPTLMTPLRHLIAQFKGIDDGVLGLYGAFGYDLLFQFEPIRLKHARGEEARDLHLFLPDRIILVDRRREQAFRLIYEFDDGKLTTDGAAWRAFEQFAPTPAKEAGAVTSEQSGAEYASRVDAARERMRVGDIFEVVLSRTFAAPWTGTPSDLFARMKRVNPSPYEFFIQLGSQQLVGTSPEMFVRVEGDRVESCPISGTARRGGDAMEDAARLKAVSYTHLTLPTKRIV